MFHSNTTAYLDVVDAERVGVRPGAVVDPKPGVVQDEGVACGDGQVVVTVQLVKLHPDDRIVPGVLCQIRAAII